VSSLVIKTKRNDSVAALSSKTIMGKTIKKASVFHSVIVEETSLALGTNFKTSFVSGTRGRFFQNDMVRSGALNQI